MEEGVGDSSSLAQRLAHSSAAAEGEFLVQTKDVSEVIAALSEASIELNDIVSSGDFASRVSPFRQIGPNRDSATLDRKGIEIVAEALRRLSVYGLIAKGGSESLVLNPAGRCVVVVDPFNGGAESDADLWVGTIFSISLVEAFTSRASVGQLAAGVVLYGPRTRLAVTLGDGVDIFTLDRADRTYRLTTAKALVPEAANYSIDAANHDAWDPAVRAFIAECRDGANDDEARNSEFRWAGSLAAETHRLLANGGVCLHPVNRRRGGESGPIRLFDEARPVAFLIEQAGGRASNGRERILDQRVAAPLARTPMFFGSPAMVQRIERLYARPESLADVSPLFGQRGLFRV
jgi:fructose-1,6-bisphosphatase I